jgi:hypothetical protein
MAACTSSGAEGPEDPRSADPTSTLPVEHCANQALFEIVVEDLSPEEFLERVHEDDVETAREILYSDGHPRAGEYIPWEEWELAQQRAWGVFLTAPRSGWDDLLRALHERLVLEVTPDEFFAGLTESERETVQNLVYPADHPQAGEFVPVTESGVVPAWDNYLFIRPAGDGCPW